MSKAIWEDDGKIITRQHIEENSAFHTPDQRQSPFSPDDNPVFPHWMQKCALNQLDAQTLDARLLTIPRRSK